MTEQSPGVRRLCTCVTATYPGLLTSACRTWGFGSLYTEYIHAEGIEVGFASPGVDEAAFVTDLISALHTAVTGHTAATAGEVTGTAADGVAAASHIRALVAFHVGITRVEGDGLGGAAVHRARGLLTDLTLAVSSGALPPATLVVGITANLFDDIGPDCGFSRGWIPLAGAKAWARGYGRPAGPGRDTDPVWGPARGST